MATCGCRCRPAASPSGHWGRCSCCRHRQPRPSGSPRCPRNGLAVARHLDSGGSGRLRARWRRRSGSGTPRARDLCRGCVAADAGSLLPGVFGCPRRDVFRCRALPLPDESLGGGPRVRRGHDLAPSPGFRTLVLRHEEVELHFGIVGRLAPRCGEVLQIGAATDTGRGSGPLGEAEAARAVDIRSSLPECRCRGRSRPENSSPRPARHAAARHAA